MDLQSFVFSYEIAGNLSITYRNYTTACTARRVPSCKVTDAWSICSTLPLDDFRPISQPERNE